MVLIRGVAVDVPIRTLEAKKSAQKSDPSFFESRYAVTRNSSCPAKGSRKKITFTRSLSHPLLMSSEMDVMALKRWVSSGNTPKSWHCARDLILDLAEDLRKLSVKPPSQMASACLSNMPHYNGPQNLVQNDCILEFDTKQERYLIRYATCDRLVQCLAKNEHILGDWSESARSFCAGSLKLWSPKEVLDCMRQVRDQLLSVKEAGSSSSTWHGLKRLIHVWICTCFPRCVSNPETLQSFFALTHDVENEMVQLVQDNSIMNRRGVMQKNTVDFLQLDVLTVHAADFATELTRVSVDLMRELPLDQLLQMRSNFDHKIARTAHTVYDLPSFFVLRKRTERLSNWTASVVVSEKRLRRRIDLYVKVVAIASRLVEMRNFHDAIAMISALHNPAVARLRRTIQSAGETVSSALADLTDLIRPPYQKLRKMTSEAEKGGKAFLPSLEVLVQDMIKLDEIEKNFVRHPIHVDIKLGNVWKMNLVGSWVTKFRDAFVDKRFVFEARPMDEHHALVWSFVKVLPDVFDRETLWAMSRKLEANAEGP